jgi:hypothetical protein
LYFVVRKNDNDARPDATALQFYDDLQQATQKIETVEAPEFIRLKVKRRWWQGLLLEDRVVLASRWGMALWIAERSKTTFAFRDGKGVLRKRITGEFNLDGFSANKVTFPPVTFEHYNRWQGVPEAETTEWLAKLDFDRRKRLPRRVAIIVLLALPILFMIFSALFAIFLVATYGSQ